MEVRDSSTPPPFAPVPVTRAPLLAAIRGPIVLIVLGVLFILDYSAGISIGKTWPILLIVIGLLHLLLRVRGARLSTPDVKPGAPLP